MLPYLFPTQYYIIAPFYRYRLSCTSPGWRFPESLATALFSYATRLTYRTLWRSYACAVVFHIKSRVYYRQIYIYEIVHIPYDMPSQKQKCLTRARHFVTEKYICGRRVRG